MNEAAATASGAVFIAGPTAPDEYLDLVQRYEIGKLAVLDRAGFFDLVDRLSAATGAPKAYFDSSLGVIEPEDGDLALDPRICDAKAAAAIASWLGRRIEGAGEVVASERGFIRRRGARQ